MSKPIEPSIRSEVADDAVAVRGGPLTVEKILLQVQDEGRRHTRAGRPFLAVSVFCVVDTWTLTSILAGPLSTRSVYAAAPVGALRAAGFEVLATHQSPHCDVVLPGATIVAATTLLAVLGEAAPNPHRRRR